MAYLLVDFVSITNPLKTQLVLTLSNDSLSHCLNFYLLLVSPLLTLLCLYSLLLSFPSTPSVMINHYPSVGCHTELLILPTDAVRSNFPRVGNCKTPLVHAGCAPLATSVPVHWHTSTSTLSPPTGTVAVMCPPPSFTSGHPRYPSTCSLHMYVCIHTNLLTFMIPVILDESRTDSYLLGSEIYKLLASSL